MIYNVYLSEELAPSALKRLTENPQIHLVRNFNNPLELHGIITRKIAVTGEIIRQAQNCKIICNHGTGTDQIDVEAAEHAGIPVVSAPGLNARSVAELALSFILALSFKMKFNDTGLQKGKFAKFGLPELQGNEVYGKKLGLIGSGNIARHLAEMMKNAFGAQIFCWNPRKSEAQLAEYGFKKVESLKELFSVCDFVSVHVPLTDQTKNLVNKDIFAGANSKLLLVNTARGGIVNEEDLYQALVKGQIGGAAADVFQSEPPLPADKNPLLALPNFIGTLHIGGSTAEALDRVGNQCVDNLEKYLFGSSPTR